MLLSGLFPLKEEFVTETNKNTKNLAVLNLSGGNDSTALMLLMLEKNMPIDCVLYANTGMEFPETELHIAKLDDLLFQDRGLHITTLQHPHSFEWFMFDIPLQQERAIKRRIEKGIPPKGYGWPGMGVRWCTGQLKTHLITKEVNRLKKEKSALHHIGIAADEAWRCKSATTGALTLADCMRFTIGPPAGCVRSKG